MLDLVVRHLEDWDIDCLLIHAGTSSVVARGDPDEADGWLFRWVRIIFRRESAWLTAL